MKTVVTTDEYIVYRKRNHRYAVRGAGRAWINGDEKAAILRQHDLIKVPPQKAPEPETPEPEAATDAAAEEGGES